MRIHRLHRTAAALCAALSIGLFSGCGQENPAGPQPGPVTATLVSASDEGAAVIELTGPVSSVTATSGEIFVAVRGDTTRVVVVRPDAGPVSFHFVAGSGSTVSARVIEVASPDNSLRADLAAYSVALVNDANH